MKRYKMTHYENPFYFGNEVYCDDFCNRVEELEELHKDVLSGQNILLYAPRRFGKTSLLKKLISSFEGNEENIVIYIDLFSVSSVDEFIQKYFNLVVKSFEKESNKIQELLKNILHIKPNITMKLNHNGDVSYGLSFSKKEQIQTLEEVLDLPSLYAKKFNKKVIVIFDEFQEIEQLNFEKKLRSVMQTHSRELAYIFSGSKKSILNHMFSDKSKAFYKAVKYFHINEILLKDWESFIGSKFQKTGKKIALEHIKTIFDITQGFPYYMQQIMAAVWDKTRENVDDAIINESLSLIVEREHDIYSLTWTQLTPNQKNTLKYIIAFDGMNLYTNENMNESNLNASTLKSTLEALIKKDICDKKGDIYYLIDPFMKYWLENLK